MFRHNIELMYETVEKDKGFDAVIVVSSTSSQSQFWKQCLEGSRGKIVGKKAKIYSVTEDWAGGAGQLLGSLYAIGKVDGLMDILKKGGSAAIYHTAGMGTRLAPLPLAEGANKSAVKLPRIIEEAGHSRSITLLEGVIFQTGIFADSRRGRLCVFWGDQIFIPAKKVDFEGTHHAEIFDIRSLIPTDEKEWEKEWQSYGLIIPGKSGVLQREKQGWKNLREMIAKGLIKENSAGNIELGKSLGSFSISLPFLTALREEYSEEIARKEGKLDTDPHLWMPITSTKAEFTAKGGDSILWERTDQFRRRFLKKYLKSNLLGDKDLGEGTFWWDYGRLKLYYQNLMKLLQNSSEAKLMRHFFGIAENDIKDIEKEGLQVKNSILLDCRVKGTIENSFLMMVRGEELDIKDTAIIDSKVPRLHACRGLVYNSLELEGLSLEKDGVVADCFIPQKGRVRVKTTLNRDGKQDWQARIGKNFYSYQDLHRILWAGEMAAVYRERECWNGYYRQRMAIIPELKRMYFFKPLPDNLVETVWGGNRLEALKELTPSGRNIGESWECSTHSLHPSKILLAKDIILPLTHIIAIKGEPILGSSYQDCRGEPPYFIKFLEAKENLSVQVHPSDKQARELCEKDRGKEEAWFILKAEEGAKIHLGFKVNVDQDQFKQDLLDPEIDIADKYLNAISVSPGDIFYVSPGTIHALGSGIVLAEIQQTSDITYRVWDWNRFPKRELHLDKSLRVLNFMKTDKGNFQRIPQKRDGKVILLETHSFQVEKLDLEAEKKIEQVMGDSFHILICLEGEVLIEAKGIKESLRPFQSLLVSAELDCYHLLASQKSTVLKSFPPSLHAPFETTEKNT